MLRTDLVLACSVALFSACASPSISETEFEHMLCIGRNGQMIPVRVGDEEVARTSLDENVAAIARAIGEEDHVLIYLHGGLITMEKAIEAAREDMLAMMGEDFFPIFVNWETGIFTSYGDHLFNVRHGERNRFRAIPTIPFVLLAELGRSIARLPITLWNQGIQATLNLVAVPDPVEVPEGWEETVWLDREGERFGFTERLGRASIGVVPGVLRFVTTPMLDMIGRPSFKNMERRERVLFLWDEDFESDRRILSGALSRLMAALRPRLDNPAVDHVRHLSNELERNYQRQEAHRARHQSEALLPFSEEPYWFRQEQVTDDTGECAVCAEIDVQVERNRTALAQALDPPAGRERPFKITIVAHSMGTIVANELIRRNPDFLYEDIVYMGAACTVKDFADTALVYVRDHPFTRFYNLVLHPVEEQGELYAYGTLPHGSLLVWIDDFVTEQRSALDRTLGRWNNVVSVIPVVDNLREDVRQRIQVRGFGRLEGQPRGHGEFNDFPYWKRTFWDGRLDPRTSARWGGGDRSPRPPCQ